MNWYIFSDYVFISSALTDMPEQAVHGQSTATDIITGTRESERVALGKRGKIASHKKCASGILHINVKSKRDDLYRRPDLVER